MSTPNSPAEPRYHSFRWFVLATLLIVTSTTALALISPAPLTGEIIKTSGGLSAGEVTWMTMGTFNLFVAIAALTGGYLVDKLGFIKIYIAGVLLILTGWLLMPVIGGDYWGMVFIRLLQGLGTGPIMASSASVAANYFPRKERGIVTGVQGAAMSFGIAMGLAFVPQLFDSSHDWQIALRNLWPVAVVALIMSLVVAFGPAASPTADEGPVSAEEQAELKGALKGALANPLTWVAVACIVLLSWVYQAFNDLTPGFLALKAPVGLGKGPHGSDLLVWAQGANVIGSLVCVLVTEKVFRGRVRPGIMMGFLFGALGGAGLLLPAVRHSDGLLIMVLVVAAFFFAWINPNALAYIAKTYPGKITGKLGGLAMGIGIFGGTAGVAAGASALHNTGRYTLSIIIMCTVSVAGGLVALALRQSKKTEQVGPAAPVISASRVADSPS
ncbi:MFS transporter [Streptomyces sp. YIM S03343]